MLASGVHAPQQEIFFPAFQLIRCFCSLRRDFSAINRRLMLFLWCIPENIYQGISCARRTHKRMHTKQIIWWWNKSCAANKVPKMYILTLHFSSFSTLRCQVCTCLANIYWCGQRRRQEMNEFAQNISYLHKPFWFKQTVKWIIC